VKPTNLGSNWGAIGNVFKKHNENLRNILRTWCELLENLMESMEAPQNRWFYGKMECHPLWPTYIGEKGRTFGKTYGIEVSCYWEHLWNLWNMLRTWWEHIGNKLKKKKDPPPQDLREKNQGTLSACWAFPLAAWNFLFPKLFVTNNPVINWWYLFIWRQPTIT